MTSCTPSYITEILPIDITTCGAACQGVTFVVTSVTTSTLPDGRCGFEWKITRKSPEGDTLFADTAELDCPSVKSIMFYCDNAKNCPRFRLTLMCGETAGGGVGG